MSIHKKKTNQHGFTIFELLVVVAIIIVFISVVISNFYQIKLQSTLSRVTYKFNQDVKKAQNMALSALEYKDSFGNIQLVEGYGVYINFNNLGKKKYIIYADKQPGNQQYNSLDYVVETIDFSLNEPGVIIKELVNVLADEVSINFNSSNLNTKITQLNRRQNYVDIIFALESDINNTRIVSINTSGLVEVK